MEIAEKTLRCQRHSRQRTLENTGYAGEPSRTGIVIKVRPILVMRVRLCVFAMRRIGFAYRAFPLLLRSVPPP